MLVNKYYLLTALNCRMTLEDFATPGPGWPTSAPTYIMTLLHVNVKKESTQILKPRHTDYHELERLPFKTACGHWQNSGFAWGITSSKTRVYPTRRNLKLERRAVIGVSNSTYHLSPISSESIKRRNQTNVAESTRRERWWTREATTYWLPWHGLLLFRVA